MQKKIYLIIFCDTDPVYSPNEEALFDKDAVWDTTIGCIEELKKRTEHFRDCNGHQVGFSWLLRSDIQTFHIWDDWCYPARRFRHLWDTYAKDGDEIGWHPHLWRFDEPAQSWYQEIGDPAWITRCLEGGHQEISHLFCIESVRMGWFYHNTYTMNLISDLGVAYDFSGIPGMRSNRGDHNIYNWERSVTRPYHPCRSNYCREDPEKSENLPILEIPMTVYPQPLFLQILTGHRLASINIAKHPLFYRSALRWVLSKDRNGVLFTYFHPRDISRKRGVFSLDNMIHNLQLTLENVKKRVEVECITSGRIARNLSAEKGGDQIYQQ